MDSIIEYDSDGYFQQVTPLTPAEIKLQKINQRNALRQSKWRKNHPERHAEQQRKYRLRYKELQKQSQEIKSKF